MDQASQIVAEIKRLTESYRNESQGSGESGQGHGLVTSGG